MNNLSSIILSRIIHNFRPFYISIYLIVALSYSLSTQANQEANLIKGKQNLPEVILCKTPEPQTPSSAFDIFKSEPEEVGGYWVRYQCKQKCEDWRECLVPAYSDDGGKLLNNGRNQDIPKQALAFVIDGMGGHLALSSDGDKTLFIHTGAGGTRYYMRPAETLEKRSSARTVMIRWEKGYSDGFFQPPFVKPIDWGWYSRTSEEATNIKELNKRVASIINWVHDNLSDSQMFATFGCSMGTNATYMPVLWHGLDPIIDYQMFVGGPNMWDLNAQCHRRTYTKGYCDMDGVTQCKSDDDCRDAGEGSQCVFPAEYTTIDKSFALLPNHIHKTNACDIRNADDSTPPHPAFDQSSMGFVSGADWHVSHKIDLLVDLGAEQGSDIRTGEIGGDEYWGLGHFPYIYGKIQPAENKRWLAYPDRHHCGAMFDKAIDVIEERMGL